MTTCCLLKSAFCPSIGWCRTCGSNVEIDKVWNSPDISTLYFFQSCIDGLVCRDHVTLSCSDHVPELLMSPGGHHRSVDTLCVCVGLLWFPPAKRQKKRKEEKRERNLQIRWIRDIKFPLEIYYSSTSPALNRTVFNKLAIMQLLCLACFLSLASCSSNFLSIFQSWHPYKFSDSDEGESAQREQRFHFPGQEQGRLVP